MTDWEIGIKEPDKPACYDRLGELTSEDWDAIVHLTAYERHPPVPTESRRRLNELGLMDGDELTDDGRKAYAWCLDFQQEWDYEKDGTIYKSCAVVATDGKGNDVLLHCYGPAFDWHVEQYGHTCDALCLDGYTEPGVWVFEGTLGSVRHETLDGTEWDLESEGDWRAPTDEEWVLIKDGECPWDKETLPRWPKGKFRDRTWPEFEEIIKDG